jgi:hypothetical protein
LVYALRKVDSTEGDNNPSFLTMAVILTYDVDSFHDEVKECLIDVHKYQKTLAGSVIEGDLLGKAAQSDLPNTTLYHPSKTIDQASADIKAVAASVGAKLLKYLTFEVVVGSWRAQTSRLG